MLSFRRLLLTFSMAAAPAIAALALTAPPVTQAAVTIYVDDVSPADNCGKYDGKTAQTDPVAAISTAASGSTIIICPGTYALVGDIPISGVTKLTVKRALTDPGNTPTLVADPVADDVFSLTNATGVTLDGLVIDGRAALLNGYAGIRLEDSGITLKNSVLRGSIRPSSSGLVVNNGGGAKAIAVTVSNTVFAGYISYGVDLYGPAALALTTSTFDATDGGQIASAGGIAVRFYGVSSDAIGPSGSVSTSRMLNSEVGVEIYEAAGVTVSDNVFVNTASAVYIEEAGASRNADNIKVTGNTIRGVPANAQGISVLDVDAATATVKNLTITGNVITAQQYGAGTPAPAGISIFANVAAATTVTGTLSGNTLLGFQPGQAIVNNNGYAGVTISTDNISLP